MIRGKKITLRTVKETDLATYYTLLADVQNKGEYYPQHFQSYTDFLKGYHNRGFWHEGRGGLVIVDAQDTLVGEVTFRELAHRHALDLGYIVFDPSNRNQGMATEALTLFAHYLFATRPIQRLELAIIVGNAASKKVAQRCGFTFEGISRKAFYVQGHYVDLENYARVRE